MKVICKPVRQIESHAADSIDDATEALASALQKEANELLISGKASEIIGIHPLIFPHGSYTTYAFSGIISYIVKE